MIAPAGYECPRCGARVGVKDPWRPFCSERCKMVDLGGWWLGHYRVSTAFVPGADEVEEPLPTDPVDPEDAPR